MNARVVRFLADPLKLRPAVAEAPAPLAEPGDGRPQPASALALRVLTGPHAGAQVPVRHHRVLVGNLEDECDVVLDVGREAAHACLVRASHDGWTVLSVSGHLWVQETWVPPQQAWPLHSGDVLTLGETAFCVVDRQRIDWAAVRVPDRLQPAGGRAVAPKATPPAEQGVRARVLGRVWPGRATSKRGTAIQHAPLSARDRLLPAAALVLGVALLVAAGALIAAEILPRPARSASWAPADRARAALVGLDGTAELSFAADPAMPSRLLLGGYLPGAPIARQVSTALSAQAVVFEPRWTLVDALQQDLAGRLRGPGPTPALRYRGQGGYALIAPASTAEWLDAALRRAFADLPALQAVDVQWQRADEEDTRAAPPLRYGRGLGGALTVSGPEPRSSPAPVALPALRELRLGAVPSVVLDDGSRYFRGAVLPGGAVLLQIGADHIEVQLAGQTRRLDLPPSQTPVSGCPEPLGCRAGRPKGIPTSAN